MAPRPDTPRPLGLAAALVPVAALVLLLGLSFFLFRDAAAAGPNQVALVFCAIIAALVAWRHGHSVEALRDAAVASVTTGLSAIFILLAVGALIGTWAMSGTLVAMVYYGLQLLNPQLLLHDRLPDLRRDRGLASAAPGPSPAPSASG